jgi:hypothetical protein
MPHGAVSAPLRQDVFALAEREAREIGHMSLPERVGDGQAGVADCQLSLNARSWPAAWS